MACADGVGSFIQGAGASAMAYFFGITGCAGRAPVHTGGACLIVVEHRVLLGIDFGLRCVGVAVGQTISCTAEPLTVLACVIKGKVPWEQLDHLVKTWRPDGIIVGVPVDVSGAAQPITRASRKFVRAVGERYPVPTYEVDERYTTMEAKREFRQNESRATKRSAHERLDSWAAAIILETWLREYERQKNSKTGCKGASEA